MHKLLEILKRHSEYVSLSAAVSSGEGPLSVFGLGEAQRGHMMAALCAESGAPVLIVTAGEAAAQRLAEELQAYGVEAYHFPARELALAGKSYVSSSGLTRRRIAALMRLCDAKPCAIVASAAAVLEKLAPPEAVIDAAYAFEIADRIEPVRLMELMLNAGYERTEVCEAVGQACLRGGYVDVYPVTRDNPVRIEFFDDEIDTMREYDPLTQRSIENITSVRIPPATEAPLNAAARKRGLDALKKSGRRENELTRLEAGGLPDNVDMLLPLFYDGDECIIDYLPKDAAIIIEEPSRVEEAAKAAHVEFLNGLTPLISSGAAEPELACLVNSPMLVMDRLNTRRTVMLFALLRSYSLIAPKRLFKFESRQATRYLGNTEALCDDISTWKKHGYTVLMFAGTNAERLRERLSDSDVTMPVRKKLDRDIVPGESLILGESVPKGFEYPELKLAVISETELYGDAAKRRVKQGKKRPQLAFSELETGDLIVHELYGIGRFTGVESLCVAGVTRDYLRLHYADGEKLYIPTDQLDRVQKYIGGDESVQKLSKLGSGEWQRTLGKTRESVKKLAFDLVKLYGERSRRKGFKYSPDSTWQRRLEESFPYEETPDQLSCIEDVKRDMESDKVMDRLLCGDVGYGKTEVALRACFKAVMDNKQAAILVPTTILAQQHYNTLAARFSGYPVEVALLSRFNTPASEKQTLERLEKGAIDVVVGTHKLLSKSVKFKDLGLLIVDEEQRFGVGHKEQMKNLRLNVDVLTLTATPIPRTLHMSMTGIRDMSVIETPPEQRYPVQTYVMEYDEGVMREAVSKELARGGQVFFVYNKVKNMEHFAQRLRALMPDVRIATAHGQMSERTLERTMLDFMDGAYDVLLCSTIIESGLDIQNVNTIIIYDADCMGLSQLYQLRGRVGRGARLGYAYLTFKRDKVLSEVAEKRLEAIREFTQFGSGFKVAMRDLEIRGAGNLLGPEQHGHMEAVGYDLYCKLVENAVREAKGERVKREIDTAIEVPIAAGIPNKYISRESDRLSMYKRIAMVSGADDVLDVRDELIDRYGDIPESVENLLTIALLKAYSSRAYITKLRISDGEAAMTFEQDAPVDVSKLYALVQRLEGAHLTGGETPMLCVKRPLVDAAGLCTALPQIVYTVGDCIENVL